MTLSPFTIGLEKEAEGKKVSSPNKGGTEDCKGHQGDARSPPKRRSCERRLFVPTSPERRRPSDGALGSSFLSGSRLRYDTLSRYYYRPHPEGRGGSVGSDNENGEFVPAPGTWLVNSRLEIISYPIPGMFSRGEPGGVYVVEEDDDQDLPCRIASFKDEGFESSVNMLEEDPLYTRCGSEAFDSVGEIDDPPDGMDGFKPNLNSTLEMSGSLEEIDYVGGREGDLDVQSNVNEVILAGSFVTTRLQLKEEDTWRMKDSGVSIPEPFSLSEIVEKMQTCYSQSGSDESDDNNSYVISGKKEFQTGVASANPTNGSQQEQLHMQRS